MLFQSVKFLEVFQYFLAILIGNNIIEFPIKNYYFHITEEFQLHYPNIQTDNAGIFLYGGLD